MGLNVQLLRSSFELIAPRADELAERFYQILFEDNPGVKPMFANTDMKNQQKMLIGALSAVMDLLDKPEELTKVLHDMGAKHAEYDVKEEQFPAVGAALLKTLEEIAGDAWSPELNTAWSDAYGAISSAMIVGLKSVKPVSTR